MRARLNANSETLKRNSISRAAEILEVLEKIYGQPPYPIETKTDEERQAKEAQEENAEAVSGNQTRFAGKANSTSA